MKIQVTEMVKKEVEITTPCYVKSANGHHVYHVMNENRAIQIFSGMSGGSISFVHSSLAFNDDYSIIKAKEYKEVFNNVLKALSL
jgi:hypothetical protein